MNAAGAPMGVILAAGKGTRMRPFSEHYPKPLLPVLGKSLIVHQLEILVRLGVTDVVVVIGHLGHEVVRCLGDGAAYGVSLRYVEQEQTLGIAHAVSKLEPHVDRTFFLLLGDIFFETENLGSMLQRMDGRRQTAGVLAVKRELDAAAIRRNFIVLTDGADHDRVTRVIEKPRHPRSDRKGCGIYLFDPAFFDAVRRTPRTALRDEYEITDAVQIFIDDGYRVEAAEVVRDDVNVSYAADLLDLNLRLLDAHHAESWVAPDARVAAGASLQRSVVMQGATVAPGARLVDCVVFPGAAVAAERALARVIVTPEGEIRCDQPA